MIKQRTRPNVTDDQAAKLADMLANKTYGEPAKAASQVEEKARPISISLPPSMIEKLQDEARDNARAGEGARTVSGILRVLLEKNGY